MRSLLLLLWTAAGVLASLSPSSPEPPAPGPGNLHVELKIYLINSKFDFCPYCLDWCLDGFPPRQRSFGLPDLYFRPGRRAEDCPFDCDDHLFHYLQSQTHRWLVDNRHRAPMNHPLRASMQEYAQYGYQFAERVKCSPEGGSRPPKSPRWDPSTGAVRDWDLGWKGVMRKLRKEYRGTPQTFHPDENPWEGWFPMRDSIKKPNEAEDPSIIPLIGRPGGGGGGGGSNGDGTGGNGKTQNVPNTAPEQKAGGTENKPQVPPKPREPVGAGRGTGDHPAISQQTKAGAPQSVMGIPLGSLASGLTSQLSNLQAGLKQQGANIQAMNHWTDCMVTCVSRAIVGTPDQIINIFQACSVPNGCDGRAIGRFIPQDNEAVNILKQVFAQSGQQIQWLREKQGESAAAALLVTLFVLVASRGRVRTI